MLISNLLSDLKTDLISNFGKASMLNHTMNFVTELEFVVWLNMEAIPNSKIKSVIKSDIRLCLKQSSFSSSLR